MKKISHPALKSLTIHIITLLLSLNNILPQELCDFFRVSDGRSKIWIIRTESGVLFEIYAGFLSCCVEDFGIP